MKRFIRFLLWLDCWIVDKWLNRGWEYYSAVLGKKELNGSIRNRLHQKWIARMLNYLDPDHCKTAIKGRPPSRRFWDIFRA